MSYVPSSPIAHLPAVLVQLTVHFIKLSELLQFARCSRQLLSQVDSAFAFKHVGPLVRLWSQGSPALSLDKLMAHVPITLKPTADSTDLPRLLSELPSRLYGLDASDISVPAAGCLELLSHPCMQSLRQLTVDNKWAWCQELVFTAISGLPSLHTVSMLGCDDGKPPSVELLRLLSRCPSITALRVHDTDFCAPSRLAGVVGFPSLKQLTVRRPWIYNDEWVGLFASPGLCKLISLTLDWCIFSGPSNCEPLNPDYAAAVFTSLTHLSSLHLKMPFGVDLILPSLRCAPALTALRVEACCASYDTYAPRVLPSFAVLRPLMIAQPQLRIEIDLRDHESPLRDEYVSKLAADFAAAPADVRNCLTVLYGKPPSS